MVGELAEMILNLGPNIYKLTTKLAILLLSIVFRLQNAGNKRKGSDGLLRVIEETHAFSHSCTLSAKINGPIPQNLHPISAIASKEKVCRMYLRVLL